MKPSAQLPPEVKELLNLAEAQSPRGFVLVGGTALSIHLGHRQSEDIDLMFLGEKLPSRTIQKFEQEWLERGYNVLAHDYPEETVREFDNAGEYIADFQRSFIVGKTRVEFMVANSMDRDILEGTGDSDFRVASVSEIFAMKAHLITRRSSSRDIYDIYSLLKNGHFTPDDFDEVFAKSNRKGTEDLAWSKLITPSIPISDPGYLQLCENPPSIAEMGKFFAQERKKSFKKTIEKDDPSGRKNPDLEM